MQGKPGTRRPIKLRPTFPNVPCMSNVYRALRVGSSYCTNTLLNDMFLKTGQAPLLPPFSNPRKADDVASPFEQNASQTGGSYQSFDTYQRKSYYATDSLTPHTRTSRGRTRPWSSSLGPRRDRKTRSRRSLADCPIRSALHSSNDGMTLMSRRITGKVEPGNKRQFYQQLSSRTREALQQVVRRRMI